MELSDLQAEIREAVGNGPARALRREGRIPAVFYGPKTDPLSLSIRSKDLEDVLKKTGAGQVILNLTIEGLDGGKRPAMIKELQVHPVTRHYLHLDLYEIDMARKIRARVPVAVQGKAAGVERGGMMQLVRRELEVYAMPLSVPQEIVVDVTELDIGDAVHVEEITVPDGVEIVADVNFTVVTVVAPQREEEPEEAEETEEGAEEGAEEESEAESEEAE